MPVSLEDNMEIVAAIGCLNKGLIEKMSCNRTSSLDSMIAITEQRPEGDECMDNLCEKCDGE